MDIDGEKLEQVVLALFQMNLSDDSGRRVWKSLPWERNGFTAPKGLHLRPSNEEQVRVVIRRGG